jgi:CubicO group peptidase (beta-lactamase class C family)
MSNDALRFLAGRGHFCSRYRFIMKKIKIFILLMLASSIAFAQNIITRPDGQILSIAQIDHIVKKLMDTAQVTGMAIGIINNGRVFYVNSYGYKNKPKNELNDTSTCFYAASLSKALFAYVVMQLVDEHKFDLDKPLYEYLPKPLPEYDNYKDLAGDGRWKLITGRMCLDHTTGFPNWRFFNPHGGHKLEIFFTPGTRYAYSGEGIELLQFAIETTTGKNLEELAQEMVFQPFGMIRTSYLWQPRFETDYAVGHDFNEDTLRKSRRKKIQAAGSMETTIADYSRFMAAIIDGKGLSNKAWNEMLSPQIIIRSKQQFPSLDTTTTTNNDATHLAYGLGWGLFNTPYGKAFFKEGHDDGWVHYALGFPDKKIAYVVMCNSSNGESIFKELYEKLSGVTIPWYWENYLPYRENVKLPVSELEPFVGKYTGKLKAIIKLVNGQLKVECADTNLPPTNLYAQNDHHFFLKVMATDIEFVKDANGKVTKAILDDEGEHYELIKIK